MKLSAPMQRFVVHWGEMGSRWGVNRSIAQIHALLYLTDAPLHAEDISEVLQIARSNVSNSLKELQGLALVRREHVLGDRRDHFTATHEPWDMLMAIAEARKQREIDPLIEILRECADAADADPETPQMARDRLRRMEGFVTNLTGWYAQIRKLPQGTLVKLMGLGTKIARFVGG
ncbi:MAG: DNA-binding transcriptional regulator GbsR (MarR family) [Maricaulis maris]|jgi:DNA-binding transcriptional regulator GbsR (MarR family)|uniref:HTH-type transcriptional regulator n=2 Tax=Maricaulaceae TaxID=2800061 RepID=Q0AKM7_MARMM|nr:MarR family transcriptional regulator [Maricaulis maris]ABI67166.1 putative transcriptional regulator [Maricaulis maris MCS10]MAC89496.1 ArsR family transcriptional regulator [Maricaulis sp.]